MARHVFALSSSAVLPFEVLAFEGHEGGVVYWVVANHSGIYGTCTYACVRTQNPRPSRAFECCEMWLTSREAVDITLVSAAAL
jgi:hypothetical protein